MGSPRPFPSPAYGVDDISLPPMSTRRACWTRCTGGAGELTLDAGPPGLIFPEGDRQPVHGSKQLFFRRTLLRRLDGNMTLAAHQHNGNEAPGGKSRQVDMVARSPLLP